MSRASRVRQLSPLLLGGLLGLCLRGQAPLPAGSLTPDALSQFCSAQTATECAVPLRGQYTLALNGEWRLPRSVHLRFAEGSALHISGGTLDFQGSAVEAAEASTGQAIFPDGDRVHGLAAARPEWFGAASTEPVPASALAAAYRATETWGTIYLQARSYVSPFGGCPAVGDFVRYLSPRTLVGSGRAVPDDLVHPTHLEGGTVLLGGIMGTAPVRAAHLGIDTGPQVSAGWMQGCELPAVFIEQPASRQFVTGDRLEDVSVLTTDGPNMHSVMIAGHDGAQVRDLWIWTLGGTHGLVMKSSNSVVDGLHCWGASADCLVVKSDYATDLLGRAVHDRVAHVEIHPLTPGGDVGGIVVDSSWDTVRSLDMRDITETGTRYGMVIYGSRFYRPRDISIENWTTDAVTVTCLLAYRADALHVSGLRCGMRPSAEAGVVLRRGHGTSLDHVSFTCQGDARACAAAHTDGVHDDAAGTTFQGIEGQGLGGYLLRGAHPLSVPGEFHAVGMNGRIFAPDQVSDPSQLQELAAEIKPDMRIVYTAANSQMILHTSFFHALIVFLALLVAALLLHRHRRSRTR